DCCRRPQEVAGGFTLLFLLQIFTKNLPPRAPSPAVGRARGRAGPVGPWRQRRLVTSPPSRLAATPRAAHVKQGVPARATDGVDLHRGQLVRGPHHDQHPLLRQVLRRPIIGRGLGRRWKPVGPSGALRNSTGGSPLEAPWQCSTSRSSTGIERGT